MREVAFIEQNKEKWLNFEQMFFKDKTKSPEELVNLYTELLNDLAYAQTFYPGSETQSYLNQLAANAYLRIYKTKRYEQNPLAKFFKQTVPMIAYEYRRYIYFSFILFTLFVLIGVFSTAVDETFPRLVLGDAYVNQTKRNIAAGNPIKIYEDSNRLFMFLNILMNNIAVSMRAYVMGIFGGFGTGFFLFHNGIMLGTFQYMFYNEGVLLASMKGIWIHGAMEIFALVIVGGAGLMLGASILFPKTYSRMESMKIGFKKSIALFASTIPFTFAAAILESYVTYLNIRMSNFAAAAIIFSSLAFIAYYYLVYPYIVKNKILKPN